LKRALEAAGGDAGRLLTLADYAEKTQRHRGAIGFRTPALESPKLRPAHQGGAPGAGESRHEQIHDVLAGMLRLWPTIPRQNDEAYTRLLLLGSNASMTNHEMRNDETDGAGALSIR